MALPAKFSGNVADAIFHVQRAVDAELSGVQDKAKDDVTRAIADAKEAQRERDELLRLLESERLNWKHEKAVLQASVGQAEMTVRYHAETILQLQRSEESARRDALDWKEQLRVEQERCRLAEQERRRLSVRLEEVVSEQLSANQVHAAPPLTPQSRQAYTESASASAGAKRRTSTSHYASPRRTGGHLPSPIDAESPSGGELDIYDSSYHPHDRESHAQQHRRAQSQSYPQAYHPRTPAHVAQQQPAATVARRKAIPPNSSSSTHQAPHVYAPSEPRVIRRVRAVVEMPVKEESISDQGEEIGEEEELPISSGSGSTSAMPRTYGKQNKVGGTQASPMKRKGPPAETIDAEEEEEQSGDEVVRRRRRSPRQDDEDEDNDDQEDDDELMIGVEEDHEQVYGPPRTARGRSTKVKEFSASPVKKRKLLNGGSRMTNNSSKTRRVG